VREIDAARLLILETSGRIGQVAVAQGPNLRGQRRLDETRRHARDLAPAVKELLTEPGWRPTELDAVIVGRGPGSYTGLRVGIASAQALAYATGCAVVAVDTFLAIAQQAPAGAVRLAVLADAQQDKAYVQEFSQRGDSAGWQPATDLGVLPFADFLGSRDPRTWLTGPGLHRWLERLPKAALVVEQACWEPRIESLLAIGLARLQNGERDDFWRLEPLYARPSAAEQKWAQRDQLG
jgi:tRNA threonylcarbamoyladenosine biosynthesis protein TsaB